MDSALAWIGQIAEWFGQFIPRRVVLDTTEGAVKWVNGCDPVYCPPGKHWWWPWTTKWSVFPTVRQTVSIETQTLESLDGKTFIVSGTLTYSVTDLLKLLTTTHDADTAIAEMASTTMGDTLTGMTWEALYNEQRRGTIKTKLKNGAKNELEVIGVNVIRFKINSLARCRVLKVSQSTASEER
jgi:hypothetical protein